MIISIVLQNPMTLKTKKSISHSSQNIVPFFVLDNGQPIMKATQAFIREEKRKM